MLTMIDLPYSSANCESSSMVLLLLDIRGVFSKKRRDKLNFFPKNAHTFISVLKPTVPRIFKG